MQIKNRFLSKIERLFFFYNSAFVNPVFWLSFAPMPSLHKNGHAEGYANLAKTRRPYWELCLKASRVVIVLGEPASTACSRTMWGFMPISSKYFARAG